MQLWAASCQSLSVMMHTPREPLLILNNTTLDPVDLLIHDSLLPELLPSAEAYVILKHYVSLPIFATSIVCILVTIAVVTRRGLWRPTVTYVVMLAIVDLLILLLLSILSLDYFIIPWTSEKFRMWFYSAETVLGESVDTLLFISNWLTAMLATERYVAICYPLQSRRISRKHRRIVVTMVIVSSLIIRTPGFVLLNMSNDPVTYPNIAVYQRCYVWIVQVTLFLIAPFALLTFVNLRLIQAVRRSSKLLRATFGAGLPTSGKSAMNSQLNSLTDTSNQMSDRRQCSKSTSDYFKFGPIFRTSQHGGSMNQTNTPQAEQCAADSPSFSLSGANNNFHNPKLSENQYAIALTLHGPSGMHVHRAGREERKITVTLVCLVITFFIFQGPSVLTSVLIRFTSASKSVIFENLLIPLSLIALAIKSDLYFFLYCWFCERFLNSLCNLFGLRKLRDWIRHVRERCKSRLTNKQCPRSFPCIQKPSLLQEYQLPHHYYGYYGKHPSFYVRGSIAHNRYPFSYKPPPLPFVMNKKRRFSFWPPQLKWNWLRSAERQESRMKNCNMCFLNEQNLPNIETDAKNTFVPPPDSYFSKRRVVLIPDSRSHKYSMKSGRASGQQYGFLLSADSRFINHSGSDKESGQRSLLKKSKIFTISSTSKHKISDRNNGSRNNESSTSTATDSNDLRSGDHSKGIPEESLKLISSRTNKTGDSWLPIRLNRPNPAFVSRDTASAPVSAVVDVCVHHSLDTESEIHGVSELCEQQNSLPVASGSHHQHHHEDAPTWSV